MSLRPSSSASVRRPTSSASNRPPSSASAGPSTTVSRPSSSASIRPSSSAGSVRRSTISSRAESRTTLRPSSRHDYVSSRQASRLAPLYRSFITQLTGITPDEDEDAFHTALDFVTRSLDQTIKPSGSADMTSVQKHLRGYIQKARVNSNDELATALEDTQKRLRSLTAQATDLDDEIQLSRLPSHLSLLLTLAMPPETSTLQFADLYEDHRRNPQAADSGLTWAKILAEEPFEGQHWEGVYGLPPESIKRDEDWDTASHASHSSTPSLSPWDDDDDESEQGVFSPIRSRDGSVTGSPPTADFPLPEDTPSSESRSTRYNYRYEVEDLQARQYWKAGWHMDVPVSSSFSMGDPSTLGPTLQRLLGSDKATTNAQGYISEHDAVREVLLGLQGIQNIMLSWINNGPDALSFVPSATAPAFLHLSLTAQHSILSSFATTATTLEHLRKFVKATFTTAAASSSQPPTSTHLTLQAYRRSTCTLEAFAEAIDIEIHTFDRWCASREEQICRAQAGVGPPLVVSLLSLESALSRRFSASFSFILGILRTLTQRAARPRTLAHTSQPTSPISSSPADSQTPVWTLPDLPKRLRPAALTALLHDLLLLTIQDRASMGDVVASQMLVRVFCSTATPLWAMVHHWLKDGMPVPELMQGPLPNSNTASTLGLQGAREEFFVEDNELPLVDPDFWREGFVLRKKTTEYELGAGTERTEDVSTETSSDVVPLFLRRVAQEVLEAGKAVGLLRALGVLHVIDEANDKRWMGAWRSFKEVLVESSAYRRVHGDGDGDAADAEEQGPLMASSDDFARMVYDELVEPCKRAKAALTRVLVEDCDLWLHLTAMEDLYLMRKGDVMSNFVDVLFARMDTNLNWNDFHFLNSSFSDVVSAASSRWIDPSLVRFSHRGSPLKAANISRTVRAIEGLFIEYAVPFPLTYIFGPLAMQLYSSLLVFMLQIRRAKNALERILVRNADVVPHGSVEMKVFYAMRGRLSWFVNALLNFICTNVLHTEVLSFHAAFKKAGSLDEMIDLHDEHLSKLESRCLLQRNTASLHRAIVSILDMTLHFTDCFVAFAGNVTLDISRHSTASTSFHKHRSRKQRRLRRNVIGFSQTLQKPPIASTASSSDSSDEDVDEDLASAVEPSFYASETISFVEESFVDRVGKMSAELDALVRFVRRGVESLASSTSEAASAFEVFAFALEDWDQ